MVFELAQSEAQIELVYELFREYQQSLDINLCFQNFEQELLSLPGKYEYPRGRLYLLVKNACALGCVALRPIDETSCEMKRLCIRPAFRGQGWGQLAVEKIIAEAQSSGYKKMFLDTLPGMQSAITLYKKNGFKETAAYCFNPVCGAIYMVLKFQEDYNV